MNKNFGPEYASVYDRLYQDKDYESECNVIQELLKQYGTRAVESILDLGCGTGGHALILANRGYAVHGVDVSEEMLGEAARKVEQFNFVERSRIPSFSQGDIRKLELGRLFDATIMMFAVLGYQYTNKDVISALETAYHHTNNQGLLLCDFWYGPAVLKIRPQDRVRVIESGSRKIIRTSSTELEHQKNLAHVTFNLWELDNREVLMESAETHTMRYFFPMEIELLFTNAGFHLAALIPFPNIDEKSRYFNLECDRSRRKTIGIKLV